LRDLQTGALACNRLSKTVQAYTIHNYGSGFYNGL